MNRLSSILEVPGVNRLKYFHSCTVLYGGLSSFTCRSERKTVNGIVTVIIVKMWRCVQFCTFLKKKSTALCNCRTWCWMILIIRSVKYVQLLSGYFTQIYSCCDCVTFCNIKTTKHSHRYVTKHCCILPLCVVDGCVRRLEYFIDL